MRLLVDAQLPPALARFLVERGCAAEHVADLGLRFATDPEIWVRAQRDGCALMTKDEDFFLRWLAGKREVPIVWLRGGNIGNRELFTRLQPLLPDILGRLAN